MSKKLKKYAGLITNFKLLGRKSQKAVEKNLDKGLLQLICEICFNILHRNVEISSRQKKKLVKHKSLLKTCSARKLSKKIKIKRIAQKGSGFFVPLLFSIIGPLLNNILNQ